MKLTLIALGKSMPPWVDAACLEYQKRLPKEMKLEYIELAIPKRTKNITIAQLIQQEAESIKKVIPLGYQRVVLDEKGKHYTSQTWAEQLQKWRDHTVDVCFIIGGPDGISESILAQADLILSLSHFTFAHGLARVVLMEQLYRAWSIMSGHPYHRNGK